MVFKAGQVVLVEGDRHSWIHRAIAFESSWWWTHAFLVVSPTTAIEATFPKVREFDLQERLAEYLREGRSVVVLDQYQIADGQRAQIALQARSYVGRWYNLLAVLWFTVFHTFTRTGGNHAFFCSRLVAASYREGAGIDITDRKYGMDMYSRTKAMRDGYLTPYELLTFCGFITEAMSDGVEPLWPMI
jgi:uncharacterized protein YycO